MREKVAWRIICWGYLESSSVVRVSLFEDLRSITSSIKYQKITPQKLYFKCSVLFSLLVLISECVLMYCMCFIGMIAIVTTRQLYNWHNVDATQIWKSFSANALGDQFHWNELAATLDPQELGWPWPPLVTPCLSQGDRNCGALPLTCHLKSLSLFWRLPQAQQCQVKVIWLILRKLFKMFLKVHVSSVMLHWQSNWYRSPTVLYCIFGRVT